MGGIGCSLVAFLVERGDQLRDRPELFALDAELQRSFA